MKIARLAGLMLVAVLAMSLVAVSAASAAGPLFLTSGKPTITATALGLSTLATPGLGVTVTCEESSSGGEISSTTLAGKILVHFLECTATKGTETCPAMSPGAPLENLIITHTLHGVLGLVLPVPATGSDVGLLLLPSEGKKFVTLLGTKCLAEATVEGSVAGLVGPVNALTLSGTLSFGVTGGAQNIKDIDLTNGPLVKPELLFASDTSTESANYDLAFSNDVEVM